jgi:hypothetical protein
MKTPKIINILSPNTFGGTFLDWSLHFLAGHNTVYSGIGLKHRDVKLRNLVNNPLNALNAHEYIKNHPTGYDDTLSTINHLEKIKPDGFHTVYCNFLPVYLNDVEDSRKLWDMICTLESKTIWLHMQCNDVSQLYLNSSTKRCAYSDDFDNVEYLSRELEEWRGMGLTNVWDYREFMALSLRPFDGVDYKLDFSKKHIHINPISLMTIFDSEIHELCAKLGIEINSKRKTQWSNIYFEWREHHNNRILWVIYFNQIMEYIVQGYDMDLTKFNIDIRREATIQHVLIYKYGLNLKTWGLEVFPNNTKDIHLLLEENNHLIEKYNIPI